MISILAQPIRPNTRTDACSRAIGLLLTSMRQPDWFENMHICYLGGVGEGIFESQPRMWKATYGSEGVNKRSYFYRWRNYGQRNLHLLLRGSSQSRGRGHVRTWPRVITLSQHGSRTVEEWMILVPNFGATRNTVTWNTSLAC
jgi:hypothetical protein